MPHWITGNIISDLNKISNVSSVESNGQGGSYDTDNLVLGIVGSNNNLFVCGFDADSDDELSTPGNSIVQFIELTDGLSSNGGLNSKNKQTSKVYIAVRQYFIDIGFNVVPSIKPYF